MYVNSQNAAKDANTTSSNAYLSDVSCNSAQGSSGSGNGQNMQPWIADYICRKTSQAGSQYWIEKFQGEEIYIPDRNKSSAIMPLSYDSSYLPSYYAVLSRDNGSIGTSFMGMTNKNLIYIPDFIYENHGITVSYSSETGILKINGTTNADSRIAIVDFYYKYLTGYKLELTPVAGSFTGGDIRVRVRKKDANVSLYEVVRMHNNVNAQFEYNSTSDSMIGTTSMPKSCLSEMQLCDLFITAGSQFINYECKVMLIQSNVSSAWLKPEKLKTFYNYNLIDMGYLANNKDLDFNSNGLEIATGRRTIPTEYIPVKPNTEYTFERPIAKDNIGFRYYDEDLNFIGHDPIPSPQTAKSVNFTTPNGCYYWKFVDEANTLNTGYSLVETASVNQYEDELTSNIYPYVLKGYHENSGNVVLPTNPKNPLLSFKYAGYINTQNTSKQCEFGYYLYWKYTDGTQGFSWHGIQKVPAGSPWTKVSAIANLDATNFSSTKVFQEWIGFKFWFKAGYGSTDDETIYLVKPSIVEIDSISKNTDNKNNWSKNCPVNSNLYDTTTYSNLISTRDYAVKSNTKYWYSLVCADREYSKGLWRIAEWDGDGNLIKRTTLSMCAYGFQSITTSSTTERITFEVNVGNHTATDEELQVLFDECKVYGGFGETVNFQDVTDFCHNSLLYNNPKQLNVSGNFEFVYHTPSATSTYEINLTNTDSNYVLSGPDSYVNTTRDTRTRFYTDKAYIVFNEAEAEKLYIINPTDDGYAVVAYQNDNKPIDGTKPVWSSHFVDCGSILKLRESDGLVPYMCGNSYSAVLFRIPLKDVTIETIRKEFVNKKVQLVYTTDFINEQVSNGQLEALKNLPAPAGTTVQINSYNPSGVLVNSVEANMRYNGVLFGPARVFSL